MRTSQISRILPALALLWLLSLGACSDSPTKAPVSDEPTAGIVIHDDLALSLQSMLAGKPADLVATIKFTPDDALMVEGVTLCTMDESGDVMDDLAELTDDGAEASGDIVPGDRIYTGTLAQLAYDSPREILLAVRILSREVTTGEPRDDWSATRKLEVMSTELVFANPPAFTPQGLFASTMTAMTVLATLSTADSLSIESVRVYHVNAAGDSAECRGSLRDNGNLDNHDEIEADGIYSGILQNLFVVVPQTYYLRVLAKAVSTETALAYYTWSPILEVPVEYPTAQGSLNTVLGNLESAQTNYWQLRDGGASAADARAEVVAWLAGQQFITEAYLSPDEVTAWAVYYDGLEAGVILPEVAGEAVFGGGARPSRGPLPLLPEADRRAAARGATPILSDRDAGRPDEAHSNMAVIISPFHSWVDGLGGDSCDEIYDYFTDKSCPWSFDVGYYRDIDATVEVFSELYLNGAVCIATHGTLQAGGQAVLLTGEPVTLAGTHEWYWDLYSDEPGLCVVRYDDQTYFAVKSSFIAKYNPVMPNSVVSVSACQGMRYSTLRQAFLGAGAGYVAGFDGTVGVPYADGVMRDFWQSLIVDGAPAGEARGGISPPSDPDHGSSFMGFGNAGLAFGTGFHNSSFETGNLASWRKEGDGRVIGQLEHERPMDGSYTGILSTGLGYTLDSGEISQLICIPEGAPTLEFDYNFFSEEFLEWCGSGFQDYFQVSIVFESDEEEVLFYTHIDDMCDFATPADVVFDQGPHGEDPVGVYKSGWLHGSADLSPYAGERVRLRFAAGDIGDKIYDSAILLDNIDIKGGK